MDVHIGIFLSKDLSDFCSFQSKTPFRAQLHMNTRDAHIASPWSISLYAVLMVFIRKFIVDNLVFIIDYDL